MLRRSLVLLIALAACTEEGSSAPSSPAPLRCVLPSEGPQVEAVELYQKHDDWIPRFGPCGHLVVDQRGLVPPTLDRVEQLPMDASAFAPTGEALLLDDWQESASDYAVLDLATDDIHPLGTAGKVGWSVVRDRSGSLLWLCNEGSLRVYRHGAITELPAAPTGCDGRVVAAANAPVLIFPGPGEELTSIDLETGETAKTGIVSLSGIVDGDERVRHDDYIYLSADGTALLYQPTDQIFEIDYFYNVARGAARLVDLRTGEDLVKIAARNDRSTIYVPEPTTLDPDFWFSMGYDGPGFYLNEQHEVLTLEGLFFAGKVDGRLLARNGSYPEPERWFFVDPRTGESEEIEHPVASRVVVSQGRHAMAMASTACDDCSWSWDRGHGWREHQDPIFWVGDDGSVLVGAETTRLEDAGGKRVLSFDGMPYFVRAEGDQLLVQLYDGSLRLIDRTKGTQRVVAKSNASDAMLDASGTRMSWRIKTKWPGATWVGSTR